MKVKVNMLISTIILTIIVFCISTYLQKKIIKYEATVSCLVLNSDINENELVDKNKFKVAQIPISLVANQRIVQEFSEIEGLYAKDNIKTGQIVVRSQFDTNDNLSIFEAEEGKEKISIKIKSAENGMSFQIKEGAMVNVYATIRTDFAKDFLLDKERMIIGNEEDGYTIIKIINNVKVLGTFTVDGVECENSEGDNIDSILISVTPEEAKEINLIREIATFNITSSAENKIINMSGENI